MSSPAIISAVDGPGLGLEAAKAALAASARSRCDRLADAVSWLPRLTPEDRLALYAEAHQEWNSAASTADRWEAFGQLPLLPLRDYPVPTIAEVREASARREKVVNTKETALLPRRPKPADKCVLSPWLLIAAFRQLVEGRRHGASVALFRVPSDAAVFSECYRGIFDLFWPEISPDWSPRADLRQATTSGQKPASLDRCALAAAVGAFACGPANTEMFEEICATIRSDAELARFNRGKLFYFIGARCDLALFCRYYRATESYVERAHALLNAVAGVHAFDRDTVRAEHERAQFTAEVEKAAGIPIVEAFYKLKNPWCFTVSRIVSGVSRYVVYDKASYEFYLQCLPWQNEMFVAAGLVAESWIVPLISADELFCDESHYKPLRRLEIARRQLPPKIYATLWRQLEDEEQCAAFFCAAVAAGNFVGLAAITPEAPAAMLAMVLYKTARHCGSPAGIAWLAAALDRITSALSRLEADACRATIVKHCGHSAYSLPLSRLVEYVNEPDTSEFAIIAYIASILATVERRAELPAFAYVYDRAKACARSLDAVARVCCSDETALCAASYGASCAASCAASYVETLQQLIYQRAIGARADGVLEIIRRIAPIPRVLEHDLLQMLRTPSQFVAKMCAEGAPWAPVAAAVADTTQVSYDIFGPLVDDVKLLRKYVDLFPKLFEAAGGMLAEKTLMAGAGKAAAVLWKFPAFRATLTKMLAADPRTQTISVSPGFRILWCPALVEFCDDHGIVPANQEKVAIVREQMEEKKREKFFASLSQEDLSAVLYVLNNRDKHAQIRELANLAGHSPQEMLAAIRSRMS